MSQYTRLNLRERCTIGTFLSINAKIKTIAERTGRHRSTIYREIKRNHPEERYFPGKAHALAKQRHPHPPNKIDTHPELNKFVLDGLIKGWSPEQISGRMLRVKKEFYVCHESIYRYVYRDRKQGLYKFLPRKKPNRCFGMLRKANQKIQLLKRNISYRTEEVNLRNTFGHWEGDTIHFSKGQQSTVTTLLERKSRFVLLRKNKTKKSQETVEGIYNTFKSSPKKIWSTLTLDQGSEFMAFHWLERQTKLKVYFCDPHSPWQRGGNENMNGRLRRLLPRSFKIEETNQDNLDRIAILMNNTPRKCLKYQTPREVLRQRWRGLSRIGL
jgi:IS30 family transposase